MKKKIKKLKERHYYYLHWEYDRRNKYRVFKGTVFCFQNELWDLKTGDTWSIEYDKDEIIELRDLGTKYRK